MSSREFLNVAHFALVEEFQRPRHVNGITVPGLPLQEALEAAAPWAEGYEFKPEDLVKEATEEAAAYQPANRGIEDMSEEEIVAKNNAALAWVEQRLSGTKGGLGSFNRG